MPKIVLAAQVLHPGLDREGTLISQLGSQEMRQKPKASPSRVFHTEVKKPAAPFGTAGDQSFTRHRVGGGG
ncbi:hypothetical protein, partial [Mesorhizobium sp.]